jgi:hypothetical protein
MPHRLVSEIPAGPPGVVLGESGEMVWMKRFAACDPGFAG